jgi:hypothetical protein
MFASTCLCPHWPPNARGRKSAIAAASSTGSGSPAGHAMMVNRRYPSHRVKLDPVRSAGLCTHRPRVASYEPVHSHPFNRGASMCIARANRTG